MKQYHDLLKGILIDGDVQFQERTEEYVIGLSGWQSVYDLREGFPLMTTKKPPAKSIFEELFWKLRGERNVKTLFDKKVPIWNANAFDMYLRSNGLTNKFPKHSAAWNEEFSNYCKRLGEDPKFAEVAGDLGPVYGYQWRHWKKPVWVEGSSIGSELEPAHFRLEEVDQLKNLLDNIKNKPGSRYHLLSAWNPGDIKDMALPPCPMVHQFSVWNNYLDLHMYQRSCDTFLGVPFNIAQDSLLTHMVAKETGLIPRKFIHTYANVHFYLGVPPRANFWKDATNVEEFKKRIADIKERSDYLKVKEWYIETAPPESPGNEKKDHIPFVLEQLSKEPKELPRLRLEEKVSLLDAIKMNAIDYAHIESYDPHIWDAKAEMAV